MKINNIIFKDVKEFNIIFLILISIFLVGISGYSSYAIFSDEIVSNNEIKGIIKKQDTPGVDTIVKKVGKDGIVAETHPATSQLAATTDYRYTGKNPNNYVKFNNETWRIIGVFEIDDGTGNLEKRIKIIRDSIGKIAWDSNNKNDWSISSGKALLNSGDYYNRTGSYASTGLTSDAKSMIANVKWYLGGTTDYYDSSNGLARHFYSYERGTTVYSGNPTSWIGKVGLMYPSDYGYATSGGSTTNRDACLAKEMYSWEKSGISDCKNNDWLYDSSNEQWLLIPSVNYSVRALFVNNAGTVYDYGVDVARTFRPTVYLKPSIQITGGDGSSSSPYELTLPPQSGADTIIDKVGSDGLVAESHPATTQLVATTDYRYTGKNPNNYIKFNNEIWRIIGVFDTDDGTGKLEKRIKIIRDSLGNIAWDSNGVNDWTKATGMTLLNSGAYWNRTGGYATNGLTAEAKSQIADTKWYLGGTANYNSASTGLAGHFYSYERGTTVYDSTRPTSWIGKVGLMYISDYGYATSGGTIMNREACLAKEIYNWYKVSECFKNDWLYITNTFQWTLVPDSRSSSYALGVGSTGDVTNSLSVSNSASTIRPTVFLSSDIKITGGSGTSASPYEISK